MAKYNVTFSCGHDGIVDLVGKHADRKRKLEWYADSAVCPECYKKAMDEERAKLAKEREEQLDAAKDNAAEFGWPELEANVLVHPKKRLHLQGDGVRSDKAAAREDKQNKV